MRIRHLFLILALIACGADAAGAGILGTSNDEPPRVAALSALPIDARPPDVPFTQPLPTYAPTPHETPVTTPTTQLPLPVIATTPPPAPVPEAAPEPAPATQAPATVGPTVAVASAPPAVVARARGTQLSVWKAPEDRNPAFALYSTTELGSPRVFLVTGQQGTWVHVMLALRPNGSEGWVRVQDVDLSTVADRVEVNLATRTLVWSRAGQVLLVASVAVGAASTPTPPGRYYVTDVLPYDPNGPYGAWVVALNGHSESFATFDGGDPRLAIHGTNDPGSIGAAASSGCVRAGARDIAALAAGVPLGTPVTIS